MLPTRPPQSTLTDTADNMTQHITTTVPSSTVAFKPHTSLTSHPTPFSTEKLDHAVGTQTEINSLVRKALDAEETIPQELPIKTTIGKFGLMFPTTFATTHAAAPLLNGYATDGCPVDCGADWSSTRIIDAITRGAHRSAYDPAAVDFLREETREKIKNGYARVVKWRDIKHNIPPKLKISPVAMVPHKSKLFRVILDLSFRFRKRDGSKWESVNSATTKLAPQQSMSQLGSALKRIVATMADHFHPQKPFIFTKLDIKDGFWRMAVNDDNAWNFCYVLPSYPKNKDLDTTDIVVPNSLQMGWCESPPFFCAGSETARDVIESLLPFGLGLPHHPLEDQMLTSGSDDDMSISSASTSETDDNSETSAASSTMSISSDDSTSEPTTSDLPPDVDLIEVFVDDFMGVTNNTSLPHLQMVSRSMLHGIHSVFPPPTITGHTGGDSISEKKIAKGEGQWRHSKELLGWLVDGKSYTIRLPRDKEQKALLQLRQVLRHKSVPLTAFQKLAGRLQYISFAMPGGWGLFSPIYKALQGDPKTIHITPSLREALRDWRTIIKQAAAIPTHVLQLVDGLPNFLAYCDACKRGVGGVVMGITKKIGYFVWRLEWPPDIREALVTWSNPQGTITMNDLELAGIVISWLVLEYLEKALEFCHVGIFCDNTTAVAWSKKLNTAKSIVAAKLLRFLCLRMHRRRAAPLLTQNISGEDNKMADVTSRSFKCGAAFDSSSLSLSHFFNKTFPLPQQQSWTEFRLPPDITSRVISCVRGEVSTLGSLLRLKKIDKNTGNTGAHTPNFVASTHFSKLRPNLKLTSSSQALLHGSGRVSTAKAVESKFTPSMTRSRPSPRPSNWLENPAPSTKRKGSTPSRYNDAQKE